MKCHFAMKKILFTLLFIASEIKYIFVSAVVVVNRPIKKCKKTERDIETSVLEITIQAFIEEVLYVKSTQQLIKTPHF